jgi:thiamine biosynthesis lipoprotein
MRQTKLIMGMPITVEIIDNNIPQDVFNKVFTYFKSIDNQFSTYKENSEISKINRDELLPSSYSQEMREVLRLCMETKVKTNGYFNANRKGFCDPSGIVKGWAILNAAKIIKKYGYKNFYIEAGGDIQAFGKNGKNKWKVGIKDPFAQSKIVKIIKVEDKGVATSGTYIRGQHIYNPKNDNKILDVLSLTVIGPNIYEADRFATGAFAMGIKGINFIENLSGFEGYIIDKEGIATMTSGFEKYVE